MSGLPATSTRTPQPGVARPVSRPTDAAEREADRIADIVSAGGAVRGWSLASSPTSDTTALGPVQRDDSGKEEKKAEDPDAKEYEQAAKKTGEALLRTEAGRALERRILESPEVERIKEAATSPAGIAIGATAIAGGLTGLALAGKELPFQPPTIPLDRIRPGLSADLKIQGPLNAPTFVGLTVTFKPKKAAERAAEKPATPPSPLAPARSAAEEQQLSEAAIDEAVRRMTARHPLGVPVMKLDLSPRASEERTDEPATPVQRSPDADIRRGRPAAVADVDEGFDGAGRPLDERVRATMEARFGHDFSSVRLHDDARASAAAARVDARAFTVGADIVLGAGVGSASPHLLAHELAHVVQQRGGRGPGTDGLRRPGTRVTAAIDPAATDLDVLGADAIVAVHDATPDDRAGEDGR